MPPSFIATTPQILIFIRREIHVPIQPKSHRCDQSRRRNAEARQAVETGEYASSSEVVRDALRDWARKRQLQQNGIAELRKLWQQARADKTPGVSAEKVLDRLERKYQALADTSGAAE